jgi:hypothetical protein
MKQLFYNSKGFNTVKISVKGIEEVDLFYYLNDNPVQHIWQQIHSDTTNFKMGVSHLFSKEELNREINELCKIVGTASLTVPVDRQQLNDLHNRFVLNKSTSKFQDEWQRINLLIHSYESLLSNVLSEYNASVVFYKDPLPLPVPLQEEHKLWLTPENKWGSLLLGYATLGKDWIDIATDDDNLDDLKLQSSITSETLMMFNADQPYIYGDVKRFYQWAKESNYNVPLDNLNKLSLGRYILGEIIITDAFLKYNPNTSDWYVPNHNCRLNWGKDVLGKTPYVTNIEFFESDMYVNTLMEHTNNAFNNK